MKKEHAQTVLGIILFIYFICFAFRGIEYMFIRTDQSILGEAFIHKLIGIGILFVAIKYLSIGINEIGFLSQRVLKSILYGLLLGSSVYALAYGFEFFMTSMSGNTPSLKLYVTSYSVEGNLGNQTEFLFFAICIIGNIINVVMEEGIFRGLFLKLAEKKYSFHIAVIISSVLFGFWHIASPLRSFLDAERSIGGTLTMMLLLIVTTGITGAKFCLLTKISGSLWLPMADHFFNNTIINILHISTITGADELQFMRITIAQTVSFVVVLVVFCKGKFYNKKTFR
ncbi:MAG: CPBP family intramembrane metalloprotease [Lacrimispora sp.]|uniref:CPBP family intramembrane glutamic endopeptidase n=1 Tax=Lacrimispora sp. TaxID=2719234 RepID=UPI0039E431A5